MTPTIRVDEELYDLLKEHAEPFVDTPNAVLRRLLGLAQQDGSEADGVPAGDTLIGAPRAKKAERPATHARRRGGGQGRKARRRAARGTLLPQAEYELPLLQVLVEKGGRTPSSEAIDAVGRRLDGKLTEIDREQTSSGELRWRNRAQFARLALVKSGDMKGDSPRGLWELTEKGARRAEGSGP